MKKTIVESKIPCSYVFCILFLLTLSQIAFANIDIDYARTGPLYIYFNNVVNLLENGSIDGVVSAKENSQFNILGGYVDRQVYGKDFSQINVVDGSMAFLYSFDNSFVEVTGGLVRSQVGAKQNGHIIWRGGEVTNGILSWDEAKIEVFGGVLNGPYFNITTYGHSNVILHGYDFELDGMNIDSGVFTSDEVSYNSRLTGFLLDGTPIGCNLRILDYSTITIVSKLTTTPPVADAGEDQIVYAGADGTALVKLDGSESFDADGDELEYFWYEDANQIATGVDPNVVLGVGEHVIDLIVDDGTVSSEPNSVVITVIEAIEATRAYVVPRVVNTTSRGRYVISLMQLPDGVAVGDVEGDSMMLDINNATVESAFDRSIGSGSRNYIFAFFKRSDVIAQVSGPGNCDITISSKLTTGQCIYGTDRIRVVQSNAPTKPKPPRKPYRSRRTRKSVR